MVVAHLYSDLLNLYGNDGNVKILVDKLQVMNVPVEVVKPTVGSVMDFSSYDFVFIGSGTENNLKIAISDLMRYKSDIKEAISSGKVFLIAGNSLDIFGKGLKGKEEIVGLGIFDFYSSYVTRIKKDVSYNCNFLDKPILGFENHNYVITSSCCDSLFEDSGIRDNNFMGTYVEGPILVRNPDFLEYIIKLLVSDDEALNLLDLDLERQAYDNFVKVLASKNY